MEQGLDLREALAAGGPLQTLPQRLCDLGVTRLGVQSVGLVVIADSQARSLLFSCGELAATVDELQFDLGEGPCLDAFHTGDPALEPDLSRGGRERWPAFSNAALAVGAHAVFAFPLQVGAARFGVLDAVRTAPGALADDEVLDALALARIATQAVLDLQARSNGSGPGIDLGSLGSERLVVHQATGMVAAQVGVAMAEAAALLRARSFVDGRSLHDVARDVVARELVLGPGGPADGAAPGGDEGGAP